MERRVILWLGSRALAMGLIVATMAVATARARADDSATGVAPQGPADETVGTTDKLSQYGITWTFESPVKFGRFINGDYWVLGPVTIAAVEPAWDGTRNGSMVDPAPSLQQGYRKDWTFSPKFVDDLRVKFPLRLEGTRSLVSTIGLEEPRKGGAYEGLDAAAVLTVVDSVPPQDAFRPPYVAGDKPIYAKSQLRWDRLPKLPKPEGVALPKFDNVMRRVWLDHYAGKGNGNATIHPRSNMPPYPGDSGREVSAMAMLVMLDIPEREELTCRLVQLGIDLYHVSLTNADAWRGYGGFGNGRKWPILFAGILLGDEKMQSPAATVESSNSRTGSVGKFGEDGHTYYGKATEEYPEGKPLWGNDVPAAIYKSVIAGGSGDKDARDPDGLLDGPSFGYRRICSVTWIGQALAARLMGAQKIWNHPAFFDYVDRWVKEEGAKKEQRAYVYYCWGGDFLKFMWETYRGKADDIARQYADDRN